MGRGCFFHCNTLLPTGLKVHRLLPCAPAAPQVCKPRLLHQTVKRLQIHSLVSVFHLLPFPHATYTHGRGVFAVVLLQNTAVSSHRSFALFCFSITRSSLHSGISNSAWSRVVDKRRRWWSLYNAPQHSMGEIGHHRLRWVWVGG